MHTPKIENNFYHYIAILLCAAIFIAYTILSFVRHNHYQSYGYDLGINDQAVWLYSNFHQPLSTIDPFPGVTKLATHVELIYALISPFYWIWSDPRMLLLVQVFFICSSGIAVYLLAVKHEIRPFVSLAILFCYLTFYGVQNALWFDVHSSAFAAAFLAWFLYFTDQNRVKLSVVFFLIAITAKENIAFLTFAIGIYYMFMRRKRIDIFFICVSVFYLLFIYKIFYPYVIRQEYLYQNDAGLLSNLNPFSLIKTAEKRITIMYSFLAFGFIPFLFPLTLLPAISHFFTFFVIASDLDSAQGLFLHYRITLAPFIAWATVLTITRFPKLNIKFIAIYLLLCAATVQYTLHLPLSYLIKSWFWTESTSVKTINTMIQTYLPPDAVVVSQNNITPHISQRDQIYTLFPEKHTFRINSPCGELICDYFRWAGDPQFLIVDTSPEWDARHYLIDRENYLAALNNLEKEAVIKPYKTIGTTHLYTILKSPNE
jgi:uncharacterized membrane protein